MKIKKLLFLSLFLIIGLLLFIPNTVNAANEVHADIKIDGTNIIPIIGKTPQYLYIYSENYEAVLEEWYDDKGEKVTTTFEAGKTYIYELVLIPGTAFGSDTTFTLSVDNIDWTKSQYMITNAGELVFRGYITPFEGFEIKVDSNENVIIGQRGPLVVPKGYGRILEIRAEEGYKITSVKVNGVEQTLPLENDELTLNNIQEDINVVVETEKVEIGDNESSTGEVPVLKQINLTDDSINQEFSKATDEFLEFTLINKLGSGKVFIDGIELNKDNGDYGWGYAENLPNIKISKTYLTTLKSGKHTIKFVIDNVGEAETTFTIVGPENNKDDNTGNISSADNNNTNSGNTNTDNTNSNNPQTGDNIILFVAVLGIATIGIVVTTIVRKKLQNN